MGTPRSRVEASPLPLFGRAHAKKQRSKENRGPVCVILGAEHLFLQLPFKSQREEIRDVELFKGFTGVLAHFRCNRPAAVRKGSRKEAKSQRKPRTRLCHAWSGAPFFRSSPSNPKGRRSEQGNYGCRFDGIGRETSGCENS